MKRRPFGSTQHSSMSAATESPSPALKGAFSLMASRGGVMIFESAIRATPRRREACVPNPRSNQWGSTGPVGDSWSVIGWSPGGCELELELGFGQSSSNSPSRCFSSCRSHAETVPSSLPQARKRPSRLKVGVKAGLVSAGWTRTSKESSARECTLQASGVGGPTRSFAEELSACVRKATLRTLRPLRVWRKS